MTLRAGLLLFLCLLALASLSLYLALKQSGGITIPGGKSALEQALAPYVDRSSLRFTEPRIALREEDDTVEMTLQSLAFDTQGRDVAVTLEGISALIDSDRLTQGAIRFRAAEIARAGVRIDIAAKPGDKAQPMPTAREITAATHAAYRAAFSQVGLGRLSRLSVKNAIVTVAFGGDEIAIGTGALTVQPAGNSMQLTSSFAWRGAGAIAFQATSDLFVVGGPDMPLDAALTVESEEVVGKFADLAFDLEQASVSASYNQAATENARLEVIYKTSDARFSAAGVYDAPQQFTGLDGTLIYRAKTDTASLLLRPLSLDQATLTAALDVLDASSDARLQLEGRLENLDVQGLKDYWPVSTAPGGLAWVRENIDAGRLPVTKVSFKTSLEALRAGALAPDALSVVFDMEDLLVHYRRPMPALVGAFGAAKMTIDGITFNVTRGIINEVDAAGSTVLLTDFSKRVQTAEINLKVTGSSTKLAQVLDSKPLEYFTAYGIAPDTLSGEFSGRALLTLPLLKDVLLDDIVLSARIDGQSLTLGDLIDGEALTFRRAVIELTQDAMALRSDIETVGASGALRWREDFTGTSGAPTQMDITGQLTSIGIARWMPDLAGNLFGTVFFEADLAGRGDDITAAKISADLTPARFDVPELGYVKPIGESAQALMSFAEKDDGLEFDALTLSGPDLMVIASGMLARGGTSASFSAPTIELPGLKASLNVSKQGNDWLLAGQADRFDVAPILTMFWEGALTQAPSAEDAAADTMVSVSINLDRIDMLNGKSATGARVLGSLKGDRIQQLNVFGAGPGSAPFTLTIEPVSDGRRLLLASQSAGQLASGLGMLSNAEGGQLTVQATSFERGDDLVLAGLMEMTNVRLLDTPILARMLGLGSLSGVADLARNRGLNFETVEVPFELAGGIVRVTNASAKGPALGLTANGEFLESFERGDIRGVLVPSYTINSALGRVPVIGDVLMGGENTGLIGINYRVSGELDDPELQVNAASLLTPGFLRRIFGDQKGRLEDVASETLLPQPSAGQPQ